MRRVACAPCTSTEGGRWGTLLSPLRAAGVHSGGVPRRGPSQLTGPSAGTRTSIFSRPGGCAAWDTSRTRGAGSGRGSAPGTASGARGLGRLPTPGRPTRPPIGSMRPKTSLGCLEPGQGRALGPNPSLDPRGLEWEPGRTGPEFRSPMLTRWTTAPSPGLMSPGRRTTGVRPSRWTPIGPSPPTTSPGRRGGRPGGLRGP